MISVKPHLKIIKLVILKLIEKPNIYLPLYSTLVYFYPWNSNTWNKLAFFLRGKMYSKYSDPEISVKLFIEHSSFVKQNKIQNLLFTKKYELWNSDLDGIEKIRIFLDNPTPFESTEGELIMYLEFKKEKLLTISFLVTFNSITSENEILLTRIQGSKGKYELIKEVNKLMHNMNSSYLLLAALEGFCKALNICTIKVIKGEYQLSYMKKNQESLNFLSTYNSFFINSLATDFDNYHHSYTIPLKINDLEKESSNPKRHKKHVNLRRSISNTVKNNLITSLKIKFS